MQDKVRKCWKTVIAPIYKYKMLAITDLFL